MHTEPVPKLSRGTSIFKGSLISCNSCRLHTYSDQWGAYTYGYKWAIDVLLKEAKDGLHPTDVHYYPIIYVFRHYLEIKLKELTKNLHNYMHQEEKFNRGHEIAMLWGDCKKLLIEFSEIGGEKIGKEDLADFRFIEGFIKEISIIDPKSESFRYPVDRAGNSSIDKTTVGIIDMDHFADIATWMSDYFEGISIAIDQIHQQRCEVLYYQRREDLKNSDFDPGDCYQ